MALAVLVSLGAGGWSAPARADVTTIAYYRLGEDDTGAHPGEPTQPVTRDHTGVFDLTRQGSQTTNSGSYSSDVAAAAALHTGSSLSMRFVNTTTSDTSFYLYPGDPITPATDNFGIEAWVKTSTLFPSDPHRQAVIAYNGTPSTDGWGLYQVGATYQGLLGGVGFIGSTPATTTDWVHLALVRNGGLATFYVNGIPMGADGDAPGMPTGHTYIADVLPADFPFNGNIDEVRIFTFAPGHFSVNDLLINASAVPEPASLTLLGLGALGLAGYAWRRRQLQRS